MVRRKLRRAADNASESAAGSEALRGGDASTGGYQPNPRHLEEVAPAIWDLSKPIEWTAPTASRPNATLGRFPSSRKIIDERPPSCSRLSAELQSGRPFTRHFVGLRFRTRGLGSSDAASRLGRSRRVACRERHLQFPGKLSVLFTLGLPFPFFPGLAILLCFGHRALQSISNADVCVSTRQWKIHASETTTCSFGESTDQQRLNPGRERRTAIARGGGSPAALVLYSR